MNTKLVNVTYYKNRKLYCTNVSSYVNLTDCKDLINAGYEVKFTQHGTGQDVTEQCLKEMLCKFSVSSDVLIKLIKKVQHEK